jgi:hypothetical protein
MKKGMFITVGTSLFHSATWEPDQGSLAALPEYRDWTQGELLTSPDRRMSCGNSAKIREGLKILLEARDIEIWWNCLPQDLRDGRPNPRTLMRYSAELSTLLKLADEEAQGAESLGEFLASYEEIRFVYDPTSPPDGNKNLPMIAGSHLLHYVNAISGDKAPARVSRIPALSSKDPAELLGENTGLGKLGQEVCMALAEWDQVDIIISGGYKLYGIFLAPVIDEIEGKIARMIYVHEEGDVLMRIQGRKPGFKPQDYRPEETAKQFHDRILGLRQMIGVFTS